MTDAPAAAEATAEPTADPAAPEKARRGRPRPESTIARDEEVFQALTGPKTRAELAEATGKAPNEVYLSLYRLNAANRVKRTREGSKHVWQRVTE